MYALRFPDEEDVAGLTMQQLRGREGVRVRRLYREHAERTGVSWESRRYDMDNFASGDVVNQALSAAHTSLYGVCHAVIVALGCAPGLGFVHTGHERSFVYDVADLYKAEMTIPIAFDIAASVPAEVAGETRRAVRGRLHDGLFLQRCVRDIRRLLLSEEDPVTNGQEHLETSIVRLWDEKVAPIEGGTNYAYESDDEVDF
ncbi:CRISPR-associated endonuclease Cas1 subtype I-E [Actinopolymorpha cephalotaxi]|nr:CRISPR-associated endonuclease Cas1 subtype I-E [Actinopolymorpha cephalotaxi]